MCEKAEEIQKEWEPTGGDFYLTGLNLLTIDFVVFYESLGELITGRHSKQIKKDAVWLPRQDQLQEMISLKNPVEAVLLYKRFLNRFNAFYSGDKTCHSMEQLWLTFAMKENYKKVWNGKEWVKEKNDGQL